MHTGPLRNRRGLQFEEAPGHDGHGRFLVVRGSSGVTGESKEVDVAVEDKQETVQTVEADDTDVEVHSAADVGDDDDVVEAHTWRAQS